MAQRDRKQVLLTQAEIKKIQEKIHAFFEYREDGHLYWKKQSQGIKFGSRFGCLTDSGAIQGTFNNKRWLEHRLIWLYHNGSLPPCLDHIDGNRSNNVIENLREATSSQNSFNRGKNKNNTTGYKNVFYRNDTKKWQARLFVNGVSHSSPPVNTAEEAAEFAKTMREKLHGEFVKHG